MKIKFFQDLDEKSYSVRLKQSIIYLSVRHKLKNRNSQNLPYLLDHKWFLLIKGNRLTGYGQHLYTPGLFQRCLIVLGRVAQLGEHRPYKPGVTGSSPVPPTIYTTAGSQFSLVRTPACHAGGREFESRRPRHFLTAYSLRTIGCFNSSRFYFSIQCWKKPDRVLDRCQKIG